MQDSAYVMMPAFWDQALNITDSFTGWTPQYFSDQYQLNFGNIPPFYAAGSFAAATILMDSIERSQSLDDIIVSNTIRDTSFETIYGNISFDENNQVLMSLLVVQVQKTLDYKMVLPHPAPGVTIVYPMPSWNTKTCSFNTNDCAEHGVCNSDGVCICDTGYYGGENKASCDTYCYGEVVLVSSSNSFCKNVTTYYIGGVVTTGESATSEIISVMTLAVELINNKTDGWMDAETAQVLFTINITSVEDTREAGYRAAEQLIKWVYNEYPDSHLHGIIGAGGSLSR